MAPSDELLFPSGTVVTPLQNTSARLPSIPNPVSASSVRESDVQIGQSSLTPGSIQISPRELTRSQGELARSSLENADTVTERRRTDGKRTITSLLHLWLCLIMWIRQVFLRASMRLVCQRFSKPLKATRRNVGWNLLMNRWISSTAWMTNVSDEREIFEIDVGDPLESERSFCRDSSVWLSKRLSDGKSSKVTYHRLLPGQQLQFDEAMTKELSQVLAANAVRRLSQEEELILKPERLLRMRLGSHVEVH